MRSCCRFLLFCLCVYKAPGAVEVYPAPAGIDPSDQYAVEVIQEDRTEQSFVYQTAANWGDLSRTTSYTAFSFEGSIAVRVQRLDKNPVRSCLIRPKQYSIKPEIDGSAVTFRLDTPRKISVEFDDETTHSLLIFADPPEVNKPDPDSPDTLQFMRGTVDYKPDSSKRVLYFGPGVYDVGERFTLLDNQTMYLAGGAFVKGLVRSRNASHIAIRGKGVLSGRERFPGRLGNGEHLVHFRGSKTRHTLLEGITLVDPPNYNYVASGENHTVRGVKMISWPGQSDGIGTGAHSLIEDCFLKVNDDAFKLYYSDTTVQNCVVWILETGAPFQISWNISGPDQSGFLVRNVDVIHLEHAEENVNRAVFNAVHGGDAHMREYRFENIRVEGPIWRLVKLGLVKTRYAPKDKGYGRISNLVFKNIDVEGPVLHPGTIEGYKDLKTNDVHRIENVTFENLVIAGRLITEPQGVFQIDPQTTSEIRFMTGQSK